MASGRMAAAAGAAVSDVKHTFFQPPPSPSQQQVLSQQQQMLAAVLNNSQPLPQSGQRLTKPAAATTFVPRTPDAAAAGPATHHAAALTVGSDSEWRTDPSTADGFRALYDRELSIEVRNQPREGAAGAANDGDSAGDSVGSLVRMQVKVLVLGRSSASASASIGVTTGLNGDESFALTSAPDAVRVELMCEDDLHFHYYHVIDGAGYRELAARQRLKIEFSAYPQMLAQLFTRMRTSPHDYLGLFYVFTNGTARLDFIQNLDFKFLELLSLHAIASPPDTVKCHIQYRYWALKRLVLQLQTRIEDIGALMKAKNPALLQQIKRTPLSQPLGLSLAATQPLPAAPAHAAAAAGAGAGMALNGNGSGVTAAGAALSPASGRGASAYGGGARGRVHPKKAMATTTPGAFR